MKSITRVKGLFGSIGEFKASKYVALIGVAVSALMIIAAVGFGLGAYLDIKEVYREINRSSIYVEGKTARYMLGPKAMQLIAEKVPSVDTATLMVKGQGQVSPGSGRAPFGVMIFGVTESYTDMFDVKLDTGMFISETDHRYNQRVAVIGWDIVDGLFGASADKALGASIIVNGYPLQVVGVYSRINDDPEDYYGDNRVYVPFNVALETVLRGSLPLVAATAAEYDLVPEALYELRLAVQELYPHVTLSEILVVHIGAELVQATKQALTMVLLLILVALIVLIASGKGIADAARLDCTTEMSTLAMTMAASVLGGLVGMLLSLGLTPLANIFNARFEQSIYAYVAVLLVCVVTGVLTARGRSMAKLQLKSEVVNMG